MSSERKFSPKPQAESREPSTRRGGALLRAAQALRTDDAERETLRVLLPALELFRPYPYPELPPITIRSTPSIGIPEKKIVFRRLRTGQTIADGEVPRAALLNMYEALAREFKQMRILLKKQSSAGITPADLKNSFGDTEFAQAADESDWQSVIDDVQAGATPKNMALVFLESKTGLKRQTIKSECSRARQPQKKERRNHLQQ